MPPTRSLILFAHGARDPAWAEPFRLIQAQVQQQAPELLVQLAFLELMEPRLGTAVDTALEAGCTHLTIAPLFLAQGSHLKQDLPRMVQELAAAHPHVTLEVLGALGDQAVLREAICRWLLDPPRL